jgi:hypothetical protein
MNRLPNFGPQFWELNLSIPAIFPLPPFITPVNQPAGMFRLVLLDVDLGEPLGIIVGLFDVLDCLAFGEHNFGSVHHIGAVIGEQVAFRKLG